MLVRRTARRSVPRCALGLTAVITLAACGGDPVAPRVSGFLGGTGANPDVGVVLSTLSATLTLFQAGAPHGATQTRSLTGASGSQSVTPVGFVVRGTRAAVPLGNAASVAVVDLTGASTAPRFFTFSKGNTTGAAWVDDNTILAANTSDDYVGKFTLGQTSPAIAQTVAVTAAPTAIVMAGSRAYVVSGNLADDGYTPLGKGVVTEIDPGTMTALRTVGVGLNPSAAALGPDGKLYVVNTGDYVADGTVSVVDVRTMQVEQTVSGFGAGPGGIEIGPDGRAYVSSFSTGTLVYDTRARTFLRGTGNPVCARTGTAATSPCRGASGADVGSDGTLYQLFFGDVTLKLKPAMFVYSPNTYQLTDSVEVGTGPIGIDVRAYR